MWRAALPNVWPKAPDSMTVSTLVEIEACPRRWALASARYPAIWARAGYPSRPNHAALAGQVVHHALARITRELAESGCTNVRDPNAVPAMMRVGGFTGALEEAIQVVSALHRDNPRVPPAAMESIVTSLRSRVNNLRERLQSLLAQTEVRPTGQTQTAGPRSTHRVATGLRDGTHAEVDLALPALGWHGRADLIVLANAECEIVEFKTGDAKPDHPFQVLVYAWLWTRDAQVNPRRVRARRLRIVYPSHCMQITGPSEADLEKLEREVMDRTGAARRTVETTPPEARPTLLACRNCSVRQLCDDYWQHSVQERLAREANDGERTWVDLEIRLIGRRGPMSWDALVEGGLRALDGSRVVLRDDGRMDGLRPGARLRVLEARAAPLDEAAESWVVSTTATTESFLLHEGEEHN